MRMNEINYAISVSIYLFVSELNYKQRINHIFCYLHVFVFLKENSYVAELDT